MRLTGGPLHAAQQLDAAYLLSLEPDRMLAFYRLHVGLTPKAEGYGGWDGDGRQLTGHIAGHYLSAVSYMYAATGDARFKDRANYIVADLKVVQDKHGDGYLSALADGRKCLMRWRAAKSSPVDLTSTVNGRLGTRCTKRIPDFTTPTNTPAIAAHSTWN